MRKHASDGWRGIVLVDNVVYDRVTWVDEELGMIEVARFPYELNGNELVTDIIKGKVEFIEGHKV